MPDFQGKFQYLAQGGTPAQEGACRVHFDAQTLTLTPETGAALAFDLGDLDAVSAADYEVRLPLFTGRTLVLRQLGKAFDNLAHDLTDATATAPCNACCLRIWARSRASPELSS